MTTLKLLETIRKSYEHTSSSVNNPQVPWASRHCNSINKAQESPEKQLLSSRSMNNAKNRYIELTNCSKNEQQQVVKQSIKQRIPNWKHDYYRISKTFSVCEKDSLEDFPSNNTRYNVQFLKRSLHGDGLKTPTQGLGYFQTPKDTLYSHHYIPIVKDKRKYNQQYQLRTSKFGQTWVDTKRERIMDKYKMQVNPFKTQRSNSLISKMKKSTNTYRHV